MNYLKTYKVFESESTKIEDRDIRTIDSYTSGEYHQAVLDVAYHKWQSIQSKNKSWGYSDMLDYVEQEYNDQWKMLILLGKYNQQVGNGGHYQYYENGYASEGRHEDNIELHLEMMNLFKNSYLFKLDTDLCKKVLEIMYQFKREMEDFGDGRCDTCDGQGWEEETCYDCNGSGSIDSEEECSSCGGSGEEDDEECGECYGSGYTEVEEDCEECGGSGSTDHDCEYCESGYMNPYHYLGGLDDPYFDLSDDFMELCNLYTKKVIDAYIDSQEKLMNI